MKSAVLVVLLLICLSSAKAATNPHVIDFNRLADSIRTHENSEKFPYGCEFRGADGKLHGWPQDQARAICLRICRSAYQQWQAADYQGDYFVRLNRAYAADKSWHKSVRKIYNQTKL